MKRTLFFFMLIAGVFNTQAQCQVKKSIAESGSSINIPTGEVNKIFVKPIENNDFLKSAQTDQIDFEVTYINFPEEAKAAFEYAVSIWENLLTSSVPVKIHATWEKFDNTALALGRPSTFHINFDGAQIPDTYYPVALAEKLAGENINSGEADIFCRFNSNYPWYFGTDGNTPSTKYDFVSSVLHEIVHGLGFSGFFEDNGQSGYFGNSSNVPSIYDYYLFNNQNQQLSDGTVFPVPSNELHQQLTSAALKFFSPDNADGDEYTNDWIFAPSTWSKGASIYHLEAGSGLMDAYMHRGEAIHAPEETTLEILEEMGWKSVVFDFDELNDMEAPCAEVPVEVGFFSDFEISDSELKVIFSKDYFISTDSAEFQYDAVAKKFSGNLPLDFFQGNLQYYFKLKTANGKLFTHPSTAPSRKFSLRIGPDYSAPTVVHNPVKVISKSEPVINLSAEAHDNIGINSVKIEYKINGILQEPFTLQNAEKDIYKGNLELESQTINGNVEYRIIAEDKSSRGNTRTLPSSGYYSVNVFHTETPVNSYVTDFEYSASDFSLADFSVSPVPGFSSAVLHTRHPYPESAVENEKYNLVAQLKTPVILQENGKMTFDEVVLVEPGQPKTTYFDEMFWDYVIVEGSKNGGKTWKPLTDGYDSGYDDSWKNTFESSWINNTSSANGQETLFLKHSVNLTENTGFNAGDTLIFRFRLASDKSVSGWGWAIDNLEIQKGFTTDSELFEETADVNVFPNPFTNSFYVDCSDYQDLGNVEIIVTDMVGKIVYQEAGIDAFYASRKQVDLSDKSPGIYLVNVKNGNSIISKNKIIKN